MTNEQNAKIQKEEAKLAKRQEQIRKAKAAEKVQKRKVQKLKRDARTHQLCERGGELNRLLQRPDDLTDEQVKQFLQDVFALPAVQDKLASILPPDPLEELTEQSEAQEEPASQEEPEEPAQVSPPKPTSNEPGNRPPSSPYQKGSSFGGKKGRKR